MHIQFDSLSAPREDILSLKDIRENYSFYVLHIDFTF